MPQLVRISDIGLYLRCPRLVYFDALGNLPRKISPEQMLLRSMMLSLSGEADVECQLRTALIRLEHEIPLVYDISLDDLSIACRDMENQIPQLAQGIASHLNLLFPSEVEADLRSDRLNLTGRLDRLISKSRIPSLIRAGPAPEDGVWKRDRLVLAGYALLLAEKYGIRVDSGLVEYPRSAIVREVEIHSVDKGRVLRIRDRIQQIKDGTLPDRPEDARCDRCVVKDRCETRYSLASKFF